MTNKSENDVNKTDSAEIIDKLENMPKDEKDDVIATLEMYSGPIPHPKILEAYQKLYPDAAKKIIENGLEESSHRRTLETARQKRRGRLAWATLISLVVIILVFIVLSFLLIMNGHKIIGSIFAGTSFLVFIGTMTDLVPVLSAKDDISVDDKNE
ncbi:DUF2335 domain-containing protein [Pediococcus pentosaceus]|jgi:uncharacterized membrane protein|uniref:DUF2335 domain-containing protein n=1 Tax=Pediococcus pentosaceus TaxID=1255 RepID=UPI0003C33B81|nr:DUF2335 domain-containing protein [Pediococcus pentosaceus]AHA05143.1 hypothetical protein T256_05100 [Pediococcus pentosaceus SL4]